MRKSIFTLFSMGIFLVSCVTSNQTFPTATLSPTPTGTPLPTQTILWFPLSATTTLLTIPTYTATAEMNPGIGALILSDDFSDFTAWDTAESDLGSASVSRNRLTLVAQPLVYIASMRHDLAVGNFYAELTARTSLCRGEDNYGLIVRSAGSSFYRFVISCNGMVHVERIKNGTKLTIYEPVPSGDAPPGAPGEVRVGIWAVGAEMRLFLNDRFQFSLVDRSFPNGAFGVYARSVGDTPVTVTFSDLTVYDVSYVFPTRTPQP